MNQPKPQQNVTFQEINDRIQKHMEERDWHRSPARSLAISISLEANELLEHYQWSDEPVGDTEDLGSELADILIYTFQYAHLQNIDIADAIERKLQKSAQKYPAANFKGKSGAQKKEAWMRAKLQYRKSGL